MFGLRSHSVSVHLTVCTHPPGREPRALPFGVASLPGVGLRVAPASEPPDTPLCRVPHHPCPWRWNLSVHLPQSTHFPHFPRWLFLHQRIHRPFSQQGRQGGKVPSPGRSPLRRTGRLSPGAGRLGLSTGCPSLPAPELCLMARSPVSGVFRFWATGNRSRVLGDSTAFP